MKASSGSLGEIRKNKIKGDGIHTPCKRPLRVVRKTIFGSGSGRLKERKKAVYIGGQICTCLFTLPIGIFIELEACDFMRQLNFRSAFLYDLACPSASADIEDKNKKLVKILYYFDLVFGERTQQPDFGDHPGQAQGNG